MGQISIFSPHAGKFVRCKYRSKCVHQEASMNDRAGLVLCLQKIEEKIDWRPSEDWTDYDFRLLKKEIHSCSGISISTHTLKRLFGKIKYKANYSPQHATKDALANFIGFDSWEEFLRSSDEEVEQISNGSKNPGNKPRKKILISDRKNLVRLISIPAGIIAVAAVIFLIYNTRTPNVPFSLEHATGTIPHTVTFRYDISKVRSKQIMIDFDFIHPNLGGDFILMDKNRTLLNHTYQIPGLYHPRLVINNQPVDSGLVVAQSDGWVAFYHGMGISDRFWMDNMVQNPKYEYFMTLPRSELSRLGFDTTDIYYTTHRNIRDYQLSADDFRLEARFKNGPENGGISCYDTHFIVVGEHSESYVWMMEENCHQFCELKFGENHYEGETSDLSFLSRDLTEWSHLVMEVREKNASVYFNDVKLYEEAYTRSSGEIKGLEIRFKGSGMIDYLLLTSPENDTVYYRFGK